MNNSIKQYLLWAVALVVLATGAYWLGSMSGTVPSDGSTVSSTTPTRPNTIIGIKDTTPTPAPKPKQPSGVATIGAYGNATYIIQGTPIKLVNGKAITNGLPGSSEKITTQYFGNSATGDLNNDGKADVTFLLTQSSGGSGTFYYIVAALNTPKGYIGTNAILIGDRIAPQTTDIKKGLIILNYADRKFDEPMSTKPSVGQTKYFDVVGGTLFATSTPSQVLY